ncbi:rhombosortase [Ideonella sp. BN130291]|uniref:rhombosortase n=1 Tax=Ideonella sp. BN130291 TaxID=3112940 RepID=UPI002E2625FA|nr:rhombosortase [Ideonella sp. BN130291]MED5621573.1 rhombosortase [Ideonella sp. BN130291]
MSGRGGAWLALALVLVTGTLAAWGAPPAALAWQPELAVAQPWRWWSAAFVHFSRWHALANLAGLALVAALGVVGSLPPRAAAAWCLAWPLTHLALLARPELALYGGLSGVLHAGVVVAGWHLLRHQRGRCRAIGVALLLGAALKVLLEAPWGPVLRHPADWDIAIAPLSHATGALAGLVCALLLDRRPASVPIDP